MNFSQVVRNLNNVYEMERRQKRVRNYFRDGQHNFQPEDRKAVVNWMIACADYYESVLDVIHLSVALFDLFLSSRSSPPISSEKLQCVGATCLRIAFDTIYNRVTDEGNDVIHMTSRVDPESSLEELHRMHISVSERFHGRMFFMTPYVFVSYYQIILKLEPRHDLYSMMNYLVELALYDDFLSVRNYFPPSLVAAAALYTGITVFNFRDEWFEDLTVLTGYNEQEEQLQVVHERMKLLLASACLGGRKHSTQARYDLPENNHVSAIDYSSIY
ncbi:cyclin-B1-2-like [Octopus sinensis]|uniref:Cyclin-B1-2-like n=1 Tax=Octopus sinensis TaxID=2607531 RepID=A0A6P7SA15_9MOLL|nr:cyclin-B1-2-like [Octopus sinensis]